MSDADNEKINTLLGVPETKSGTGKAEAEVVIDVLSDWDIKEQIVSLVFDTTATNSSGEVGACMYLENYRGKPVLWSACRCHIYELHSKKATEVIMGQTKDPGVQLF